MGNLCVDDGSGVHPRRVDSGRGFLGLYHLYDACATVCTEAGLTMHDATGPTERQDAGREQEAWGGRTKSE